MVPASLQELFQVLILKYHNLKSVFGTAFVSANGRVLGQQPSRISAKSLLHKIGVDFNRLTQSNDPPEIEAAFGRLV